MKVTMEMIESAKAPSGTYTRFQNKYIKKKFDSVASMVGADIDHSYWEQFYSLRLMTKSKRRGDKRREVASKRAIKWTAHQKKPAKKNQIINKVSGNSKTDWAWKPDSSDIPPLKIVSKGNKIQGKRKLKRAKISKFDNNKFYESDDWRALRARVLEKYECKCMMCGRSPKDHKIVIHVDHIKPRSKHPELSLDFYNLQLLCADCNLGKSNKYDTDWRPDN